MRPSTVGGRSIESIAMRRFALLTLMFTALLSALVVPASAQSKKEMIAKDAQLEQRIVDLESRFMTGDPAAERLMERMDQLETSQRTLTGEIEQLRYERDALRGDVESLVKDIAALQSLAADMRRHLEAVELASKPGPSAPVGALPSQPSGVISQPGLAPLPASPDPNAGGNVVALSELQDMGIQKLMGGDFTGAQLAFKQYIEVSPDASDVDEAYFWLGETYLVKSGFADAADAYLKSMQAAPKGEKAPNAMVGLAAALRGMGNKDGACQALASFPVQFPSALPEIREKAEIESQRTGC